MNNNDNNNVEAITIGTKDQTFYQKKTLWENWTFLQVKNYISLWKKLIQCDRSNCFIE
jgi:hypothetical protein